MANEVAAHQPALHALLMGGEEGVPQTEPHEHPGADEVRVIVTQRSGHDLL
jgi:hypothetical protein